MKVAIQIKVNDSIFQKKILWIPFQDDFNGWEFLGILRSKSAHSKFSA